MAAARMAARRTAAVASAHREGGAGGVQAEGTVAAKRAADDGYDREVGDILCGPLRSPQDAENRKEQTLGK